MNNKYIIACVWHHMLPNVQEVDIKKLTHINIAFGLIDNARVHVDHTGGLKGLDRIREINPAIKFILCIGGWGEEGFSEAAMTQEGRQRFADSCADLIDEYDLDGIDLDWEYPCMSVGGITSSPDDKENFTLLLACVRNRLNQYEDHKSLSIAAGADQYYLDCTHMNEVHKYLDYVQLMTYDMRGGFQVLTGHHTGLYNSTGDLFRISVQRSVDIFHAAGVPKEKIVIGSAFYGRKWNGVPNQNNGLHQIAHSTGGDGGRYDDIILNLIPSGEYKRFWDDEAKAPYLFNGSSFITYDDRESVTYKCEYLQKENLRGIMFWVYSDNPANDLIDAMYQSLKA